MGGYDIVSDAERERRARKQREMELKAHENAVALATQIVNHLNSVVIRPGPKPEERECTKVASELEAEIPVLAEMINAEW